MRITNIIFVLMLGLSLGWGPESKAQELKIQNFEQALQLFLESGPDALPPAQQRSVRRYLQVRMQLALKGPKASASQLSEAKVKETIKPNQI